MREVRLIDANRLLTEKMKSVYYHLKNGDIAIPIIDIENAPTVDAEPIRHGHWIEYTSWYKTQSCECSECGNIERGFDYPYEKESAIEHAGLYCRRCGAKMDEVTECQ